METLWYYYENKDQKSIVIIEYFNFMYLDWTAKHLQECVEST